MQRRNIIVAAVPRYPHLTRDRSARPASIYAADFRFSRGAQP